MKLLNGSIEDVEMHRLRYTRKQSHSEIPPQRVDQKPANLKKRDQISICRKCHIKKIHVGRSFNFFDFVR
jgi:hypothetical protein